MRQDLLQGKVDEAASHLGRHGIDLERFRAILASADDWTLRRIDPLRFARQHGFPEAPLVSLFVAGTRVGLFDLEWMVVCPACGGVLVSAESVFRFASSEAHCRICSLDIQVVLDDCVEIGFTIAPSIHPIPLRAFEDAASHFRWFFSANREPSHEFHEFLTSRTLGFEMVPVHGRTSFFFVAEPGAHYRLVSVSPHSSAILEAADDASAKTSVLHVSLAHEGFEGVPRTLGAGPVEMEVVNATDHPCSMRLLRSSVAELHAMLDAHPSRRLEHFNGKMLLSNSVFRSLFQKSSPAPDVQLRLRSQTFLFTDLTGSTDLYERVGDSRAYHLIREHFEVLADEVRRHEGALVKTMGDAIMAVFVSPRQALLAAHGMRRAIRALGERLGQPLSLKAGIHEGPAIVFDNAGLADYFGQAVNLAARVQGAAKGDEICVTAPTVQAASLEAMLPEISHCTERERVLLKGIGEPIEILRMA